MNNTKNSPFLYLFAAIRLRFVLQGPSLNQDIYLSDIALISVIFLGNISPNLSKDMNEPWLYDGLKVNRHLNNIVVNNAEIEKICNEIEIYKASSVENISSRVLKDALLSQIDRFRYLIVQILETGNYPELWKKATIIPLQKDGNVHSVNNLCPISLLPLPSKIVEKIIHDRMIHHLETSGYLDSKQGGFRKNNSTINTVSYLTNDIYDGINQRDLTIATYIDMAKAFYKVNHDILIKKLDKLGFQGKLLNMLKNYLGNSSQCTMANGCVSDVENVVCGIPQGSTVGPLMYIIYINDISTSIKNCKYYLYADDTIIYTTGSLVDCTDTLTIDLQTFKKWCNRKKLTLNIKKTKYTIFGLKSQTRRILNHEMFIDGTKIDRVQTYKYLGITLDMHLNYNKHLENIVRSISYKSLLLAKVRI